MIGRLRCLRNIPWKPDCASQCLACRAIESYFAIGIIYSIRTAVHALSAEHKHDYRCVKVKEGAETWKLSDYRHSSTTAHCFFEGCICKEVERHMYLLPASTKTLALAVLR